MLDNIIINIVLVLFPILIYFIYNCYKSISNNSKYSNIVLELCLISSLYLSLKYASNLSLNKLLLYPNIPILISYLKRKPKLSVLLSIITMLYAYIFLDINIYFTIISFIGYFIIYTISNKRHYDSNKFIIITTIFQAFILSFANFLYIDNNTISFINIFFMVIVFLFISIFSLKLFELIDKITNMFISISELEKDKQLKNSLFKLTHEIKNPLAVCKGYLEMINLDNREKSEKYIGIIKDEIERSLLIMADFKQLNKITLNKEILDINYLIKEVCDSLYLLIDNHNIKINFNNNEEIYISLDYNKIKQVLINIIKNSKEAIKDKGVIDIDTYTKRNKLYIKITDNGIGMDEDTLNRLTELFFTTKTNGTGLGIALSNEIIKAHNGTIEYKSKIDEGTTVIIKLPLKE